MFWWVKNVNIALINVLTQEDIHANKLYTQDDIVNEGRKLKQKLNQIVKREIWCFYGYWMEKM